VKRAGRQRDLLAAPVRSAGATRLATVWLLLLGGLLLAAGLTSLTGCGEKMAIFEPIGLFSVTKYLEDDTFEDADPRQLVVIGGNLFVVSGDGSLTKRDQSYDEIARVEGLDDPTALCPDDSGELVFVWERGARRVSVYLASDLTNVGADEVNGEIGSVAAMVACRTGIEGDPNVVGARTFLYLADPDSGLIHRQVYDDFSGLSSYGILARSDGDGARFVHTPAGMTTDADGMLLVCDADTSRNWVIRFDPTPDFNDTTPDTNDQDPWRGTAIVFDQATCEPPAAADYTLGNAAECGETGWNGAPSLVEGEFYLPVAVRVDGSGRIFVADQGNDRIQTFSPTGYYEILFGTAQLTPQPGCLGLIDVRTGSGAEDVNYGAYVFVLTPGSNVVRKLISSEQYTYINREPPPEG
jgi:hypothetical protein